MDTFKNELTSYIKAGYPLLYVTANEPLRAISTIEKICEEANGVGWSSHVWKVTDGWDGNNAPDSQEVYSEIDKFEQNSVNILCNFHKYVGGEETDPVAIQSFIDKFYTWSEQDNKRTAIVLSPFYKLAPELERFFQIVNYELPNQDTIAEIVDRMAEAYEIKWSNSEERGRVIANCSGMTEDEVENSLALSLVRTKMENDNPSLDPDILMGEKAKVLQKTGYLEYWPYPEDLSNVGGLDNLKAWLKKRKKSIVDPRAKEFGLPNPKGVMLLGPPGTGKSLSAKCLAKEWGLPLIRFDLGRVFGSLVGQSEERMRNVLKQIEAVSPVAVWIDEIEKGMAGAESSGSLDSGVTKRVFGQLLTWMEERPEDKLVYIIATANEALSLPAALLRRFDKLFWVDLPNESDRREILKIHLNKVNKYSDEIENKLDRLSTVTSGFSGAEIEKVIVEAMTSAFDEDSEVLPKHLEEAAATIVPLARLRREDIEASREWAEDRCEYAQTGAQVDLNQIHADRVRAVRGVRGINLN